MSLIANQAIQSGYVQVDAGQPPRASDPLGFSDRGEEMNMVNVAKKTMFSIIYPTDDHPHSEIKFYR